MTSRPPPPATCTSGPHGHSENCFSVTYSQLLLFPDSPEDQSHLMLNYTPVCCQTRDGETVRWWMVVHTGEAWAGRSHQETGVRVPQITPQKARIRSVQAGTRRGRTSGCQLEPQRRRAAPSHWVITVAPGGISSSCSCRHQHVVRTEARTTCEMSLCVTAEFMGQLNCITECLDIWSNFILGASG